MEATNSSEAKEGFVEKCLDPELWHACAGGMVQMPPLNSKVFYFPQGHAEHTLSAVDFGALPRFPPMILCRVESVRFLADPETDEVYARIRLVPVVGRDEHHFSDDGVVGAGSDSSGEKPTSFAKTLTQSDANNGGGFSVPRYCAETIFPPLNLRANPPVQNVFAKDVHGATWKFRHIFRGTPRRHLLTTGWSTFVNQKKLVAGDSIVFLKSDNGDLSVGIRRAKKSHHHHLGGAAAAGSEILSKWSSGSGFSPLDRNLTRNGRVAQGSVVEAVRLAAGGRPFEVVYYPCSNTPEFFVRASSVSAAMRVQWCPGMRFKMAFETEDASRISWFLGTVAAVRIADPVRWPNSPWRMLQVSWDEPDLLQNVNRVSPWLVELVSNVPLLHLSQPRKKLRFTSHPNDFPLDSPFQLPGQPAMGPRGFFGLSDNLSNNFSAGIQGTRHVVAQMGIPSPDFHLSGHNNNNNQLQMGGIFPTPNYYSNFYSAAARVRIPSPSPVRENEGPARFMLFGQVILTEQQMIDNEKGSGPARISKPGSCNDSEPGLETGHCKVFLESEDVGRTLNLSVLGSYGEMYERIYEMFGIEEPEMHGHVLYRDGEGAVKQVGEEPFCEFAKAAKRLTIFTTKPSCNNGSERKVMTGLGTGERGLGSSNRAGPLTVFV